MIYEYTFMLDAPGSEALMAVRKPEPLAHLGKGGFVMLEVKDGDVTAIAEKFSVVELIPTYSDSDGQGIQRIRVIVASHK
ncbi:TPA: hypothetical protein QDB10_002274 [Burkholderia vietnamiensis]|nr:hypothetical protein [Burkholderia vietnamiensis]